MPERSAPPRRGDAATPRRQFLAGGTTLLDLMKLDVMRPERVVDINGLAARALARSRPDRRRPALGALVRMADAADHPEIRRDYPVIAQSLQLAASAAAPQHGEPRRQRAAAHALHLLPRLRTGSLQQAQPGLGLRGARRRQPQARRARRQRHCIADLSRRFRAGAGRARRRGRDRRPGRRAHAFRFEELHRVPGDTPHIETTLQPGELITAFVVPAGALDPALALPEDPRPAVLRVRARLRRGGARPRRRTRCARRASRSAASPTMPWRAHEAEAALRGKPLDEADRRAPRPRPPSPRRDAARAQRLQDRARPAHAGPRAAACRPPQADGESDMSPRRTRRRSKIGQARAAHRRPAEGHRRRRATPPTCRSPIPPTPIWSPARSRAAGSPRIDRAEARRRARRARHPDPRERRRAIKPRRRSSTRRLRAAPRSQPLRPTEIQHDGQIVAVVVADTFEAAREAAAPRCRSTYADGDAERDLRQPRALTERRRRGESRSEPKDRRRRAMPRRAFAAAPVKIDARLRDADPAPQSDRAVHHHLRLDRTAS